MDKATELAKIIACTTVCENHGGCVSHRTRADAMSYLSHPDVWCPGCQDEEREKDANE